MIDGSATRDGKFTLDGEYEWGRRILDWVRSNYDRTTYPASASSRYQFVVLIRRKSVTGVAASAATNGG